MQEEHVFFFFSVTPAETQEATQTEAVIILADEGDSTVI